MTSGVLWCQEIPREWSCLNMDATRRSPAISMHPRLYRSRVLSPTSAYVPEEGGAFDLSELVCLCRSVDTKRSTVLLG
jgi:hypothetical protein